MMQTSIEYHGKNIVVNSISCLVPKYKIIKKFMKLSVTETNEYICSVCGSLSVILDSHQKVSAVKNVFPSHYSSQQRK